MNLIRTNFQVKTPSFNFVNRKFCILVLQQTFDAFDVDNKGYIETDMIGTIMDMLGTRLTTDELEVTTKL